MNVKASELRIGNLIEFRNNIEPPQIVKITPRWFRSSMMDDDFELNEYWHPIPLTEEWLVKFGFEFKNGYGYKFKFGYISKSDFYWMYHGICIKLQYVHQLQNLYFSLTGKELIQ